MQAKISFTLSCFAFLCLEFPFHGLAIEEKPREDKSSLSCLVIASLLRGGQAKPSLPCLALPNHGFTIKGKPIYARPSLPLPYLALISGWIQGWSCHVHTLKRVVKCQDSMLLPICRHNYRLGGESRVNGKFQTLSGTEKPPRSQGRSVHGLGHDDPGGVCEA